MKFEFQKIDVAYLRRRAEEEQERDPNKRRVTKITLTPAEWAEFMLNVGRDIYHADFDGRARFMTYRIAMPVRMCAIGSPGYYPEDSVHVIDVVRA